MKVFGVYIPRRPIIAGAFAVPIGLSFIRLDVVQWKAGPLITGIFSPSLWWILPMFIGAVYGGIVGALTSVILGENYETYGDTISVVATVLTMLLVGFFIWLIKFL